MKNMNWKKKGYRLIGLSLMLAALGSCGSDNKVEVTTTEDVSTSTATVTSETSSCVTTSSYTEFRERVSNMAFIEPSYNRMFYYFNECESKTKEIFFDLIDVNSKTCSSSSIIRSQSIDAGIVRHEAGSSKENVRDYLLTILDNPDDVTGGGSYYDVKYSGDWYRIDLCQPMIANPTDWLSGDGKESYYLNYKTYY